MIAFVVSDMDGIQVSDNLNVRMNVRTRIFMGLRHFLEFHILEHCGVYLIFSVWVEARV